MFEQEFDALQKKFSGVNWRENLDEICSEYRRLATKSVEEGLIKGFVLEANGVDASQRVTNWPERVFEPESLELRFTVPAEQKTEFISVVEFSDKKADDFDQLFEKESED